MYEVVMESMTAVGFSEEELDSVLTILAGILLLGDIVSCCAVLYPTHSVKSILM